MPAKTIDFEDWEARRMKEPGFRAAYEAREGLSESLMRSGTVVSGVLRFG